LLGSRVGDLDGINDGALLGSFEGDTVADGSVLGVAEGASLGNGVGCLSLGAVDGL